ncbi:MAG: hypothetical protein ABSF53_07395 [Terracidiphilus sp.]|jgi:DNA-directed RNA polymerase specialized sigma24 family protein
MTQTVHITERLDPDTLCAFTDGELAALVPRRIQQHLTSCHSGALPALSNSQIKKAIAQLVREPLLLCCVEAIKYQVCGAILDNPVDSVMSGISIARDTISQILQQQFGESL